MIHHLTAVLEMIEPKGPARMVLLVLANHAGQDGECWPSVARIARQAGIVERSVYRSLEELVEGGFLTRTSRADQHRASIYRLTLPAVTLCQGTPDSQSVAPAPQSGGPLPISQGAPDQESPRSIIRSTSKKHQGIAAWRRLPPSETLTPTRITMATQLGMTAERATAEWDRMADFEFRAGRRDVEATWRNWVRTALERQSGPGRPPPNSAVAREQRTVAAARRVIAELAAQGGR